MVQGRSERWHISQAFMKQIESDKELGQLANRVLRAELAAKAKDQILSDDPDHREIVKLVDRIRRLDELKRTAL